MRDAVIINTPNAPGVELPACVSPLRQTRWIGPGSLAELSGLVTRLHPRTTMLVTGGRSYLQSGADALVEPALARLEVVRLAGVCPNPDIADIERGTSLWRTLRPELIVAVGGGSVLDVAKLVCLLGPGAAPWRAFLGEHHAPISARGPLIAIPTTAGSGAEATRFAAFYVAGEKHSIAHPRLRPSHVIVDPLLTASMSPELSAAPALDALAQAIESMWAVRATPESQALAEAALHDILPCLGDLVRAPTPALRARMCRGAHLAGQAIDLSRTTAAHALSYALTADLGVSHGHAVSLVLPSVFQINARPKGRDIRDPRGAAHLARTIDRIMRLLGCRDGEEAADRLQRLVAELGLATRLPAGAAGVSAASLAGKVNAERLDNNPVVLSVDDMRDIYTRLLA